MTSSSFPQLLTEDDGLISQIKRGLQRRLSCPVHDLHVASQENGLILRGRVRTYYGKQLVQEVAMQVSGLPVAANKIEVT